MNLLIVRHAESLGNASGNYSTADADSLSCEGKAQAVSLAASLRSWDFDKIIVSPLDRTIETISPYLQTTCQRGEIWPEIAEACWQAEREAPSVCWHTQPAVLPGSVAHHLFAYRNNEPRKPAYPESFGEGLQRVHDALELLQEMADASITSALMVSHGHFIREILNVMLDTGHTVDFHHDNCGMTLMTFKKGVWDMKFCNRQIAPHGSLSS